MDFQKRNCLIFAAVMKKLIVLFLSCIVLFTACKNGGGKETYKPKDFPKPGTVVAKDEMPIVEDKLNNFKFAIRVVADSAVTSGVYDVDVDYQSYNPEGQFTMPKGLENVKPILRRGSEPYTYIIGFKVAGDTTFYDYFQVSAVQNQVKMTYIRSYTFE